MSPPFELYVISDRRRMGGDPAGAVVDLVRAGLRAFQWREKDLTPRESYRLLLDLKERLADEARSCEIFVNDRADLSLALGVHLHLTEASIPTRVARAILPGGCRIGRSTHSPDGALEAKQEGADFALFGPVYDTPSKRPFGPPLGLEALRRVCTEAALPVFAVGGVTAERIPECLEAGAAGAAVIGAVWDAADPASALRRLLRAFGRPPVDSADDLVETSEDDATEDPPAGRPGPRG